MGMDEDGAGTDGVGISGPLSVAAAAAAVHNASLVFFLR